MDKKLDDERPFDQSPGSEGAAGPGVERDAAKAALLRQAVHLLQTSAGTAGIPEVALPDGLLEEPGAWRGAHKSARRFIPLGSAPDAEPMTMSELAESRSRAAQQSFLLGGPTAGGMLAPGGAAVAPGSAPAASTKQAVNGSIGFEAARAPVPTDPPQSQVQSKTSGPALPGLFRAHGVSPAAAPSSGVAPPAGGAAVPATSQQVFPLNPALPQYAPSSGLLKQTPPLDMPALLPLLPKELVAPLDANSQAWSGGSPDAAHSKMPPTAGRASPLLPGLTPLPAADIYRKLQQAPQVGHLPDSYGAALGPQAVKDAQAHPFNPAASDLGTPQAGSHADTSPRQTATNGGGGTRGTVGAAIAQFPVVLTNVDQLAGAALARIKDKMMHEIGQRITSEITRSFARHSAQLRATL